MINGEPGAALKARSGEWGPDKSGAQEQGEGPERREGGRRGGRAGHSHQSLSASSSRGDSGGEALGGDSGASSGRTSALVSLHSDTEDTLALVHMHTRLTTVSLAACWGNTDIFFFLRVILRVIWGQDHSSDPTSGKGDVFGGHAAVSVASEVVT